LSIPDADYADAETGEVDEAEIEEPLAVICKAKALYLFEGEHPLFLVDYITVASVTAKSEGAIDMEEGEDLEVVELDQGDGWTRVRRSRADEEGFVPTTYLEIDANC